ncbi:MAG TPA: helix-turn-helix domain-containing protein [Polyangiaceae bacterium]|nr:helix-turn-helix domain-containing protein [Polyangiaceae bacterium]
MTEEKPLPRVAILALPEATASVVYGMLDMFCSAGRDWRLVTDGEPGPPAVLAEIVAKVAEPLEVANGALVRPHRALSSTPYDIVCIPELSIAPQADLSGRFGEEIAWIVQQHAAGATIATACSGAVLLAAAGLLDGCDATTHWAYCDALEARYPQVRVHRERALVASGVGQRLVMAGGGTSWLDLALYLLARSVSLETALEVAKLNLIDWHSSGQQPFARLVGAPQVGDAVIARAQQWIGERPNVEAPVASMVRLSGLPERTFKRRFQKAVGMPPLEYVHALRLERAKQLLETTEETLEQLAEKVGYEDAAFFSRLFRRKVGLTPAVYRRRFGALRGVLGRR